MLRETARNKDNWRKQRSDFDGERTRLILFKNAGSGLSISFPISLFESRNPDTVCES